MSDTSTYDDLGGMAPPESETICLYQCVDGWVQVGDEYVERMMRGVAADTPPARREVLKRAFTESYYPCPACRTKQYDRWLGGHYMPNHSCKVCRLTPARRRRA